MIILQFQAGSSASYGLSLEPNPIPISSNKNGLDINYENMIENLLLQQVLLYTRERSKGSQRLHPTGVASNCLLVRQQVNTQNDHHSMLTTSIYDNNIDEEPALCLTESHQRNSSELIENILDQYNHRNDKFSRFDQNLMELIIGRSRERRSLSHCTTNTFYSRLQWLAIGLVVDRFFFCVYFTATIVSYFVTLWLIPFSHPNLTIDIHKL